MDFNRRGFFGLGFAGLFGRKQENCFSFYVLADERHLYKCKVFEIIQDGHDILKFINEIKDTKRFIDRKFLQKLVLVSPNNVVIGNVDFNIMLTDDICQLRLDFNLNFGGRKIPTPEVWLPFAEETSPYGNFSEFSKGLIIHN